MKGIHLQPNEKIVHIERGSISSRILPLVIGVVLVVLPFFFIFPFLTFGLVGLIPPLLVFVCGAYLLTRTALKWRGTVCVLTDRRIIYLKRLGLLETKVDAANLRQINDVAYKFEDLIGRMLKIGSVRVVFLGVLPTMRFERIKDPERLHDLIRELRGLQIDKREVAEGTSFSRVHIGE